MSQNLRVTINTFKDQDYVFFTHQETNIMLGAWITFKNLNEKLAETNGNLSFLKERHFY